LVEELFQALVGAVLPDDDCYDNATLNSPASHAVHAITRVSDTQDDHQAIIRIVLPNVGNQRPANSIAYAWHGRLRPVRCIDGLDSIANELIEKSSARRAFLPEIEAV
jgi:hypothetical protein